jgi:hypothetical protein
MWRKERIFDNSTLCEIYGDVFWKSPKPRGVEKIIVVDRERIRGSRSCILETWHFKRIESVDSSKLRNLGVPKLVMAVG